MIPEGCEAELLRALAEMPFLDRLEMVEVSGWSRGAVYGAVEKLQTRAGSAHRRSMPPTPCPRREGSTSPPPGCAASRKRRAFHVDELVRQCAPSPPSGGAA